MKSIPQKIVSEFQQLAGGDYQNALLYAALAGVVVSDVLPTPAMTIAHLRIKLLQQKSKDGQLSQKELEQALSKTYSYALPAWWIAVFATIHFHKGTFEQKARLAVFMVIGGAAIGMLSSQKFIGERE